MKISRKDLEWATSETILTNEQASRLWEALEARGRASPRFDLPHVAFYAGATIVLLAMTLFMSLVWDALGGLGIFISAILYGAIFAIVGLILWRRTAMRTAGGLLVTLAVFMVPLAVYGLGRQGGFWDFDWDRGTYDSVSSWISGTYFLPAVFMFMAALAAVLYVRFPVLVLPIVVSAQMAILEVVQLLSGESLSPYATTILYSLFGLAAILVSYLLDHRTEVDFAAWGYLLGLVYFWGGLTNLAAEEEVSELVYLFVCVLLILLAVFLERRAFVVFGALGVFIALSYYAYELFSDSLVFPFALSLIGIAIIVLGVLLQLYTSRISSALARTIPAGLKWLQPKHR